MWYRSMDSCCVFVTKISPMRQSWWIDSWNTNINHSHYWNAPVLIHTNTHYFSSWQQSYIPLLFSPSSTIFTKPSVGLPLTSGFLLEYSSEYLNKYSSTRYYRKYFNTSCQWQRTVVDHGTPRVGASNKHTSTDVFPGWHVANEIANSQISVNSKNSSIDRKNCNRKWKFATGYCK